MIKESQLRATKKYQDKNYDFLKLRLNKGEADIVREMAKASGKSLNQFMYDKIMGVE